MPPTSAWKTRASCRSPGFARSWKNRKKCLGPIHGFTASATLIGKALETLMQYSREQGLIGRKLALDELFITTEAHS